MQVLPQPVVDQVTVIILSGDHPAALLTEHPERPSPWTELDEGVWEASWGVNRS